MAPNLWSVGKAQKEEGEGSTPIPLCEGSRERKGGGGVSTPPPRSKDSLMALSYTSHCGQGGGGVNAFAGETSGEVYLSLSLPLIPDFAPIPHRDPESNQKVVLIPYSPYPHLDRNQSEP